VVLAEGAKESELLLVIRGSASHLAREVSGRVRRTTRAIRHLSS
jgi:hypothetical protein